MHTLQSLQAGELTGIKRLDLSCGLTSFPEEIFGLADTLEILNLSGNALSSLPDGLPKLHKLRVIFCSDNRFTHLPEVLGQCRNLDMVGFKANQIGNVPAAALPDRLRWLILTDNQVTELPARLGSCTRLQKLMLSGNRLHRLPDEMAACNRLELLRIAANRFAHLPDWLLSLPRLAWLAYAGNPFSDAGEIAAMAKQPIPHIEWDTLELQHQLGEGASGVIYRADLKSIRSPVAVKVFKGALTSDGLPRSEKAACIAAGSHAGLIPVLGRVSGHPDGTPGLVMSLIDPSFRTLAGPPSLNSCTRDIYPAETEFTLEIALNIAHGIAAVAEHLHTQGVMHGDLYAHNILWNQQGDSLLGDFGAASFVPSSSDIQPKTKRLAAMLQRIEVRAFGCLLEELLDRCSAPIEAQHVVAALRTLRLRCDLPDVVARPSFGEIRSALLSLRNALPG
ncbi:MAG TPA: leucine-rich repeat-containing protein kinase family protein [Gallionella sp.]|nr:leucine-rich repeat-containing protein kinase family protein [Gallionella sp.]